MAHPPNLGAQYTYLGLLVIGLFINLYYAAVGRPARPGGPNQFVMAAVSHAIVLWLLYMTGAFSLIFN